MRLATVTLAFLFFSTVLATPIYRTHGDTVAFTKRNDPVKKAISTSTKKSPNSTPGRKRLQCKRATTSELIAALQTIDHQKPIGSGKDGAVYHLTAKVDNHDAVVKIVKTAKMHVARIKEEVENLMQVKQFLGWGRMTSLSGEELDYIIMPHMGIPFSETKMDASHIRTLKEAALERYRKAYHLIHGDATDNNIVYKKVAADPGYEAELIDWTDATPDPSFHFTFPDPGTPFVIPADACIFAPPSTPAV
jgi:hypothetical protein